MNESQVPLAEEGWWHDEKFWSTSSTDLDDLEPGNCSDEVMIDVPNIPALLAEHKKRIREEVLNKLETKLRMSYIANGLIYGRNNECLKLFNDIMQIIKSIKDNHE